VMGGVKSVQARTRTAMHQIEVEDQAMAIVEYHNGALGVIQGSTATYPGISERLEVHGTKGSVIIESDRAKIWTVKETAEHEAFGATQTLGKAFELGEDATASWNTQHQAQVEDFAEAVQTGRDPFITGRAALEPLKVILAIYESSRRGGAKVDLSEIEA
jgi:UDP-N-acetyl-2-amino-2-deoxyglucuronate dehydrogenase